MMTNRSIRAANPSFLVRYFLPGAAATLLLAALAGAAPDTRQAGGEPDGIVQVANLVYAGTKSSHCFSDHFLIKAEKETSISTSRRFHAVKLSNEAIYDFPLVIMTGEGDFQLSDAERENLRRYIERGGFLLASASCSSPDWDRAFRREMATVFPSHPLQSSTSAIPSSTWSTTSRTCARRHRGRWWASASAAGWEWSTRRTA